MAKDPRAFKGYARGQRTQATEETFEAGMTFSDVVAPPGFSKLLVNYDIDAKGEVLKPRPGISTVSVASRDDLGYVSEDCTVVAASEEYLDDATNVSRILYRGSFNAVSGTVPPKLEAPNLVLDSISLATVKGSDVIRSFSLSNSLYYATPVQNIHDLAYAKDNVLRHVGCFAFNNDYYSFMSNKEYGETGSTLELCKTYYSDIEGITGYGFKTIDPKVLTPKEAVMWGYNMLADDPYKFACEKIDAGCVLLGILPYKDGNLSMSPRVNESLEIRTYYACTLDDWTIKLEWKGLNDSTWNTIKTDSYKFTKEEQFTPWCFDFVPPMKEFIIRVTMHPTSDDKQTTVMTLGMNLDEGSKGSTANVKPEKFNIRLSRGMTYWQNRLVVWGCEDSRTTLFMSDVNDPSYFPYPNGADIFDEPIIHCVPLLENLLVFTKTQLYMVTLSEDGTYYSKKLIQSHLRIAEGDIHLMQVVKNMVYFKSGNYYYMVVPRLASVTGELTIAPISNSIKPLLDKFSETVENIIKILYNDSIKFEDLEFADIYNFLDFEDIHNTYVFKTKDGSTYFNVALIYNSVSRHWRMYAYESKAKLYSIANSATERGKLVCIERHHTDKLGDGVKVIICSFSGDTPVDCINSEEAKMFPNYQLLDTGLRGMDTDFKKRFRELQLTLSNKSNKGLKFGTSVFVDDNIKLDYINTSGVYDEVDDNTTVLEQVYVDDITPPDVVTPIDYYWLTGSNKLPLKSLYKIRLPITGKGYAPRLLLKCISEEKFELLNISWVYRQLYSR